MNNSVWTDRLEAVGVRMTAPRRAIVALLEHSHQALSPFAIFEQARQQYPRLGLVTVYRTLDLLEQNGLIQRVHQPDGCHMVLRAATGHQHLLLCKRCGQAVFFSGDDLTRLFGRIAEATGFSIDDHWLQAFGHCARCRQEQAGGAA